MGRSGSSALARVLSLCGGELPVRLLPPNFGNPTGYWEPWSAVEINDEFLHDNDSSWYDTSFNMQRHPPSSVRRRAYIAKIAQLLETEFALETPMILKEPRVSGLLPYWIVAATGLGLTLKFVHIFRHPNDVAASLEVRDGLPWNQSFALWLKYNLLAERSTRGAPRTFVSYEGLMRDWEALVGRCIGELGLDLSVDDRTRAAVSRFLSPHLHHHHHAAGDAASVNPELGDHVMRSYRLLCEAVDGAPDARALDQVWGALWTTRAHAPHI